MWICILRPTAQHPGSLLEFICTLMHEMCHALLMFACECSVCMCALNKIKGSGLTGHGPSWRRIREAVEATANSYLGGFPELFVLSSECTLCPNVLCDMDMRLEEERKTQVLGSLFEKIKRESRIEERSKRGEREKKRALKEENTPEGDRRKQEEDCAISCIRNMFI